MNLILAATNSLPLPLLIVVWAIAFFITIAFLSISAMLFMLAISMAKDFFNKNK